VATAPKACPRRVSGGADIARRRCPVAQPPTFWTIAATTLTACLIASPVGAAKIDTIEDQLRGLSIEDLANVEITSVFKRPEPVSKAPAAVYVISNEDIRRSGAVTLPEALRLAPNLNVVRQNNGSYAIAARGFNDFSAGNRTGNKLLVLIDGRSVYTPLFSGVFWEEQDVMLEDVERIEVVSGPGGTLWGANAVNGVINVITKRSQSTQGALASTYYGTTARGSAARYGGKIADIWTYRGYGMEFDKDYTTNRFGGSNADNYHGARGGFRTDATAGANSMTLQGDLYHHPVDNGGGMKGHNILGRLGHSFDNGSTAEVQAYADYSERTSPGVFNSLGTYDVQGQYSFTPLENHQIILGGGHRINEDEFTNTSNSFVLVPQSRTLNLTNAFIQDTVAVTDDLRFTLGTKMEYSDYSGLQHLPSARLAWSVTDDTLLWTAVSRAVRSPNRIERELIAPGIVLAAPDFASEKVIAYEVGPRTAVGTDDPLGISFL
jgi:iron complex outermembrane receptor protein